MWRLRRTFASSGGREYCLKPCPTVCLTCPALPMTSGHDLGASAGAPLACQCIRRRWTRVVGQDRALAPSSPLRRHGRGLGGGVGDPLRSPAAASNAGVVSRQSRRFQSCRHCRPASRKCGAVENSRKRFHGEQTVLFIDAIFQDPNALLSAVEHRVVLLVAATTGTRRFRWHRCCRGR